MIFVMKGLPDLQTYNDYYHTYIKEYAFIELGAQNLVTGIYLKYRLLDSIMEAGVLFVTAVGIIFMGKSDKEVR